MSHNPRISAILHPGQEHNCTMTEKVNLCKHARMDAQQEAARRLIHELCRITGLTPTRLAMKAGVRHTTLTRFLNDDNVTHTLSARTIAKLRDAVADKMPAEQFDMMWMIAQRPALASRLRQG